MAELVSAVPALIHGQCRSGAISNARLRQGQVTAPGIGDAGGSGQCEGGIGHVGDGDVCMQAFAYPQTCCIELGGCGVLASNRCSFFHPLSSSQQSGTSVSASRAFGVLGVRRQRKRRQNTNHGNRDHQFDQREPALVARDLLMGGWCDEFGAHVQSFLSLSVIATDAS